MHKVHLTTLPDIRVQILLKDIHSQLTEIHIVTPHFKMRKIIWEFHCSVMTNNKPL